MTGPQQDKKDEKKDSPTAVMQMRDFRKYVTDTVKEALAGLQQTTQDAVGTTQQQGPPERQPRWRQQANVADEVSAALDKIEKDKAENEWRTGLNKDVADLKEKTKEKAPVERNRLHRIMGWGE